MRETVCVAIKQKETGERFEADGEHGYSVRDIQELMGFGSPRACLAKWLAGDSLSNCGQSFNSESDSST
ncbi:MAG: hypothetical protein ACLSEY_13200 [Enterocloster sp.]